MNALKDLEQQIRSKLAEADERRQLYKDHLKQRMREIDEHYQRFNRVADRLLGEVIRPRMEKLAGFFDNVERPGAGRPEQHHCLYRFRHTDRFPATTTLELSVCPDERIESVVVLYRLEILPIFFPFEGEDQIVFPLDQVEDERVAEWVDRKIVQFVDTYLRLEQVEYYQRENQVTDPVCGMRLNKIGAAAQVEYQGRMYHFCTEACARTFLDEPLRYAAPPPR
jgi:YHS domain-containing protein